MTRVKVECKSGRWPDSPHLSVSLSQEGKYFHRKPLAFQAEPCDMWHLSPLQTQENTLPRRFIPRCLAQEKVEVPSRWKSAPHSSFHFKKGIPSFLSLTVLGAFILTLSFNQVIISISSHASSTFPWNRWLSFPVMYFLMPVIFIREFLLEKASRLKKSKYSCRHLAQCPAHGRFHRDHGAGARNRGSVPP